MTKIILTRHGETLWNIEKRVQGSLDSALSGKGMAQAKRLAERLRGEGIQYLYASDAPRAIATAEAIRSELQLDAILISPFLREFSFGEWEGKVWAELRAANPDVFSLWDTEPHRVQVPGGETMQAVSERAWQFLGEIREKYRGETVCLVSHGLTLKLLVTRAMGFAVEEWNKTPWQFNTAVNVFEEQDGILIPKIIADISHLEGLG
ncbi:MAG: histidine phosphatase family protein [Desulfitobacteriaceae bacterium]|nr:histidine phosphatase family protein [Desulfitobacteriaceae bacterium]MDI6912828.1 histidine phosphatase family protein [Desulfitobacteriaceae bacterium]